MWYVCKIWNHMSTLRNHESWRYEGLIVVSFRFHRILAMPKIIWMYVMYDEECEWFGSERGGGRRRESVQIRIPLHPSIVPCFVYIPMFWLNNTILNYIERLRFELRYSAEFFISTVSVVRPTQVSVANWLIWVNSKRKSHFMQYHACEVEKTTFANRLDLRWMLRCYDGFRWRNESLRYKCCSFESFSIVVAKCLPSYRFAWYSQLSLTLWMILHCACLNWIS